MSYTLDTRVSTPLLASYSISSYGAWGYTQDDISVEMRTTHTL
jgi:hypothetical protein